MIFILDTDVLSTFRKRKPHPAVVRWVAGVGRQEIATTVVTVMEIQRGIERARILHPATAAATEAWLEGMLTAAEPRIISMDVAASRMLGRMYETAALRHFIITDPHAKVQASGADLSIAAIAITGGATVVTNNASHFLQIHRCFALPGLFDPLGQVWHVQPTAA